MHDILYYQTATGDSPIEEYLDGLPLKARAKCLSYLDLLAERGLSLPRSFIAKVAGEVWELRPEFGGVEYRLFFFAFIGGQFVVVHAITKKRRRLDTNDIAIAQHRVQEIRDRYGHADRKTAPPVRRRTD